MSIRSKLGAAAALVSLACAASFVEAQSAVRAPQATRSTQTDPRWYAWLGCWQTDTAGRGTRSTVTCIVPVSGSSGVEEQTFVDGTRVARQRIDANGRSLAVDAQGCNGTQLASWSPTGRRVYLRSEYTCNTGIAGTSQSMFALTPNGEWLQVEDVRAGGATAGVVSADRLRASAVPDGLPKEAAIALQSNRLAIATARAAAARPLTSDDVIDALHSVDASVVRTWIYQFGQRFDLTGNQINALARADVPATVMQAMVGNAPDAAAGYAEQMHSVPVYRGTVLSTESPYASYGYTNGMQQPVYQQMIYQPEVSQSSEQPYSDYGSCGYGYAPYGAYGYSPYSMYNACGVPFSYPVFVTAFPRSTFRNAPRGGGLVGVRPGSPPRGGRGGGGGRRR
ncbi:MAG TPA: hypothetical protein VN706_05675 [Gemmatimonadaceae bacterium]|nr:hypothetical protein [Gemmatimonadaceae bacterium]